MMKLLHYVLRNPSSVFLGGTDRDNEGTWTWTDGSPWDYSKWSHNEPNGRPANGDALRTMRVSRSKREWFDTNTDHSMYFLCAFDDCPPSEFFFLQISEN